MADWHLWLPPALTKRRFRIYVAGHTVSVIGGWIQQIALAWLIFRLTDSIFLLGLRASCSTSSICCSGPGPASPPTACRACRRLIGIDFVLAALAVLLARDGAVGRHRHRRLSRGRHADRHLQRVRDADAPDAPQGHRRGPRAGAERRRAERAGVQHRPHDRPGDRRRAAGLRLGGLVLRHQRGKLRRHHRRPAGHAPAAPPRSGFRRHRRAGACRQSRRARLVSSRALPAADGRRRRPVRDALRASDAVDRRAFLRWPVLHRRPADERRRCRRAGLLLLSRRAAGLRAAAASGDGRASGGRPGCSPRSPGRAACRCRCC